MKTIKSLKDITTLEVGDKVVFGNLEYEVFLEDGYHLSLSDYNNDAIFNILNIPKKDFVKNLGIETLPVNWDFPEVKSLEALTAIVSALYKEYEKQNELPKTWEEFCERNPVTPDEYWIETVCSRYCHSSCEGKRHKDMDKNIYVSLQEAKAFTALIQLRQLRKCYVGDWEPNWSDCMRPKFSITCIEGELTIYDTVTVHRSMSFPNSNLAKQFLDNFKDLLEIAKPLL